VALSLINDNLKTCCSIEQRHCKVDIYQTENAWQENTLAYSAGRRQCRRKKVFFSDFHLVVDHAVAVDVGRSDHLVSIVQNFFYSSLPIPANKLERVSTESLSTLA
jgi:hypothetical protein